MEKGRNFWLAIQENVGHDYGVGRKVGVKLGRAIMTTTPRKEQDDDDDGEMLN